MMEVLRAVFLPSLGAIYISLEVRKELRKLGSPFHITAIGQPLFDGLHHGLLRGHVGGGRESTIRYVRLAHKRVA